VYLSKSRCIYVCGMTRSMHVCIPDVFMHVCLCAVSYCLLAADAVIEMGQLLPGGPPEALTQSAHRKPTPPQQDLRPLSARLPGGLYPRTPRSTPVNARKPANIVQMFLARARALSLTRARSLPTPPNPLMRKRLDPTPTLHKNDSKQSMPTHQPANMFIHITCISLTLYSKKP
jgi:hypothetical protein